MPRTLPALSSNRPDPAILEAQALFQRFALVILALTAGVTLVAWLVPALGHLLPAGWDRVTCNAAILTLLAASSIFLSRPRRPAYAVMASRVLGWFIAGAGALTLMESITGRSFHIDAIFGANRLAQAPGRMVPDVAVAFLFSGFVLAHIRERKTGLARLVDVATLFLCFALVLQLSAFIMQHLHLVEVPADHALSAPGALCLALLGALVFDCRLEYSWFAVLLGTGIAGRVARIATPIAVSIPFALDSVQAFLIAHVKANPLFLAGVGASLLSIASLCLVMVLCWKISNLEDQVRELSLRDELTGLYNRRGFYFLAEQALLTARRAGDSFSICYFDLDGLKHINDTLGHDVGSELLREMAQLMEQSFRETDILGRVGGDEFVAACKGDNPPIPRLAAALTEAAVLANGRSGRTYMLSYSAGLAKCEADSTEPLDTLIQRADHEMYGIKRTRKRRGATLALTNA